MAGQIQAFPVQKQQKLNGGLKVPYKEMGVKYGIQSPEEACDLVTPSAKRILQVNWSDRQEAEWEILGTNSVVPAKSKFADGQLWRFKRYTPEQHPQKPWLFATRITRSYGIGWRSRTFKTATGKGINTFAKCVFEVEYTRPPYNITEDSGVREQFTPATPVVGGSGSGSGSDPAAGNIADFDLSDDVAIVNNGGLHFFDETQRYLEYIPESQGDYLSVPYEANGLKFTTANGTVKNDYPGNVGIIVPAEIVKLRWYQIPQRGLATKAIYDRYGHVNAEDFYDGFQYRRAGTMLLLGMERERVFLPHNGEFAWNVVFCFKYFPYGHNRFYDFKSPSPAFREARLVDAAGNPTGSNLYKKTYFEKMFIPSLANQF